MIMKERLIKFIRISLAVMVDILKGFILKKLIRANIWGGKHTPLDFIRKGMPEHYKNTHQGQREFERAIKDLLNNEWISIVMKRTSKGSDEHLSLNPRKVQEIKQFLEREQN